jgi:hypothetical protein
VTRLFNEPVIKNRTIYLQVSKNSSDDVIRDVLRQTFASVDREYFESISESLASRVVLRFDAPNSHDPTLAMLDAATITGTSATVGEQTFFKLFMGGYF